MAMKALGLFGVSCLLVCCGGRSTSGDGARAVGGGGASGMAQGGNAVAGAVELGGAPGIGGVPLSTAGMPSIGGSPAGAAPVADAGSAGVAGAGGGAAGLEEGDSPVLDYSRPRWPMPNTVTSGLPHPASIDLSSPDVVKDRVTGLIWQRQVAAIPMTTAEGASYCSALSLVGHQDWRLPSIFELISLFPAADQSEPSANGFPLLGSFLSSSIFTGIPPTPGKAVGGWFAILGHNYLDRHDLSTQGTVVCVRSNALPNADPAPPARLLTPDVVTDTGTGLSWERAPRLVWDSYSVMKTYCEGLVLGGHDDWRMPSLVEMLSLIEPAQVWPSINTTDFPGDEGIESGWFWSATPYPKATSQSYAPGLNFGGVYWESQGETYPLLVRCVR